MYQIHEIDEIIPEVPGLARRRQGKYVCRICRMPPRMLRQKQAPPSVSIVESSSLRNQAIDLKLTQIRAIDLWYHEEFCQQISPPPPAYTKAELKAIIEGLREEERLLLKKLWSFRCAYSVDLVHLFLNQETLDGARSVIHRLYELGLIGYLRHQQRDGLAPPAKIWYCEPQVSAYLSSGNRYAVPYRAAQHDAMALALFVHAQRILRSPEFGGYNIDTASLEGARGLASRVAHIKLSAKTPDGLAVAYSRRGRIVVFLEWDSGTASIQHARQQLASYTKNNIINSLIAQAGCTKAILLYYSGRKKVVFDETLADTSENQLLDIITLPMPQFLRF